MEDVSMLGDSVKVAFDLVREEIGTIMSGLSERGQRAFHNKDFKMVDDLSDESKALAVFEDEVAALQQKWIERCVQGGNTEATVIPPARGEHSQNEDLFLVMPYAGAFARAVFREGRIMLEPGSTVKKQLYPSLTRSSRRLRADCFKDGRLKDVGDDGLLRLTQSVHFSTPSAAAQFVAGCSVNGNREWKLKKSGIEFGCWLNEQIRSRSHSYRHRTAIHCH